MKNRIVSALLAVCVIIPAAAYAAACFGPGMVSGPLGDTNQNTTGVNCPAGCCAGNLTGASSSGCERITSTSPSSSGCCTDGQTCTCPAGKRTVIQTSENTGQSSCGNGPVEPRGCGRMNVQGGVSRSGCSLGSAPVTPAQVRDCCL